MRRPLAMAAAAVALGAAAQDPAGPGDPARGRAIAIARESNCILCHEIPGSGLAAMGNVGPPLAGVGARLTQAALRERLVDPSRLNPGTLMPSYHKVDGLHRVAPEYRGKPLFSAQQVEDVVAFLETLR